MHSSKNIYLTKPQERLAIISPKWYVGIFSRGTGKTTRMQALRSLQTAINVPGGLSVFYNATYVGAQQRTLANTIAGWLEFGIIEGIDFVKNIKPPKHFTKNPDYAPINWKNIISFKNGHIFVIGSNDRPGLVNSLSITGGIFVDECRFLNEPLMRQDLYPAIRGKNRWGANNPYVFSRTYTTDMPFVVDNAAWLFDFEKIMQLEQIKLIVQASLKVEKLKNKIFKLHELYSQSKNYSIQQKHLNKIASLKKILKTKENLLNKIRCNYKGSNKSVYFDTGSFLSNISILKKNYFFDNADLRNLHVAKTSFLNIRPKEVEQMFYSSLNSKHFINGKFDYKAIEKLGIPEKIKENQPIQYAKHILSYDTNKEVDIEIDFGDMCSCSISQTFGREERYIASFDVLKPFMIEDLIKIVNDFLKHHTNKVINVYKDPSGNSMKDMHKRVYGLQTISTLESYGWFVIDKTPEGYANPYHDVKSNLINQILREHNYNMPVVRIIRETNKQLENSLKIAPRIQVINRRSGMSEIRKDKSSEQKLPLAEKPMGSTDHSDHFDIKLWHKYNHLLPDDYLFG